MAFSLPDSRSLCTIAMDGVIYQRWRDRGKNASSPAGTDPSSSGEGGWWRLGTVNPLYRQLLPAEGGVPDPGTEEKLAARGVFVGPEPDPAPGLTVMCCGQGSVWPGMGRELYDGFPEARAAMDRIAACSNWDVLALMDEKDVETIGLTRWQQPYLFLLEYAQWSLFMARGLKVDRICGHSLGELIALCLAGVYTPEVGWYIMETRSRHMADLEEKSTRETGMMAVYADMAHVEDVLARWPELYVSNYNGPEQYILSGPRDSLSEARRHLRRQRKAAVLLNITLAFHNPAMRVLRDLDYRRLMCLEMSAPRTPVLSCVTAEPYPSAQSGICSSIMDLDENSVRWVQCVDNLWDRHGVRHFLELGPGETLCTLVERIRPQAKCVPSSLRGHETECVRRALARLYALGHLDHGHLVSCACDLEEKEPGGNHIVFATDPLGAPIAHRMPLEGTPPSPVDGAAPSPADGAAASRNGTGVCADAGGDTVTGEAKPSSAAAEDGAPERDGTTGEEGSRVSTVLRGLLARACGRDPASLRAGMDLRFDLNLRSSFFPSLIEEAQNALGREVAFEDLLKVSTVGDLERLFGDGGAGADEEAAAEPMGRPVHRPFLVPCRHAEEGEEVVLADGTKLVPEYVELSRRPAARALTPSPEVAITVVGEDDGLVASLVETLASWGGSFLIPVDLPRTAERVRRMGGSVWGGDMTVSAAVEREFDVLVWQGVWRDAEPLLAGLKPRRRNARIVLVDAGLSSFRLEKLVENALSRSLPLTGVLLDPDWKRAGAQVGTLLAETVLGGEPGAVFWKLVDPHAEPDPSAFNRTGVWERLEAARAPNGSLPPHELLKDERGRVMRLSAQPFLDDSDASPLVFPERGHGPCRRAPFSTWAAQFSPELFPALTDLPGEGGGVRLPLGLELVSHVHAATLSSPGLVVSALADVRVHSLPLLKRGLVRETRLVADSRPWMSHEGLLSRMCRVQGSVRDVNALGRRGPGHTETVESCAVTTGLLPAREPLWPAGSHTFSENVDMAAVLETCGVGPSFRLLSSMALDREAGRASCLLNSQAVLALEGVWTYAGALFPERRDACSLPGSGHITVFQGVLQAACVLAHVLPTSFACGPRPSFVGFVRFGAADLSGPVTVEIERCWDRGGVVRYEAQALDAEGRCLLTVHHLEYNREPDPVAGPAQGGRPGDDGSGIPATDPAGASKGVSGPPLQEAASPTDARRGATAGR